MALLSIILPVYNVESYLSQTLDSIFSQAEVNNCEVIVINDGSTDNSLQIAREYEREHSTLRVIDKDNEGVSATRNRGIEEAEGEYIFFVDADDLVHPDALKIILEGLRRYRPDILTWHYETFYNRPKIERSFTSDAIRLLSGCNRQIFNSLMANGRAVSLWLKAIRRELLSDIRLDTRLTYDEDLFFSWKCFFLSHSVAYMPAPLYYYRQTNKSAVSRYHANLYENYKSAFEDIAAFASKHSLMTEELSQDIDYHFACRLPALTSMEVKAPYSGTDKEAHLRLVIANPRISRALIVCRDRLTASIYSYARKGDVRKMLSKARQDRLKSKILYPIKRFLK